MGLRPWVSGDRRGDAVGFPRPTNFDGAARPITRQNFRGDGAARNSRAVEKIVAPDFTCAAIAARIETI